MDCLLPMSIRQNLEDKKVSSLTKIAPPLFAFPEGHCHTTVNNSIYALAPSAAANASRRLALYMSE